MPVLDLVRKYSSVVCVRNAIGITHARPRPQSSFFYTIKSCRCRFLSFQKGNALLNVEGISCMFGFRDECLRHRIHNRCDIPLSDVQLSRPETGEVKRMRTAYMRREIRVGVQ